MAHGCIRNGSSKLKLVVSIFYTVFILSHILCDIQHTKSILKRVSFQGERERQRQKKQRQTERERHTERDLSRPFSHLYYLDKTDLVF